MSFFTSSTEVRFIQHITAAMLSFASIQYGFSAQNHQDAVANTTSPVDPNNQNVHSMIDVSALRAEFRDHASLLNSSKGKSIVVFLGNTKAGKSTTINMLARKRMTLKQGKYALVDEEDQKRMGIGRGFRSETRYPQSVEVSENSDSLLLFDLPGFRDTDGSASNLLNAAFINNVLLDAREVRYVVVIGEDQFTSDGGESARRLFESLARLVCARTNQEKLNFFSNVRFVLTKHNNIDEEFESEMLSFISSAIDDNIHQNNVPIETQDSWRERLDYILTPQVARLESENDVAGYLTNIVSAVFQKIRRLDAKKVTSLNVSSLYPQQMGITLSNMFLDVMNGRIQQMMSLQPQTLSDYEREISIYGHGNFWTLFHQEVLNEDVIALLKEFCGDQYNDALRRFNKEQVRQDHLQGLRDGKRNRENEVRQLTENKIRRSIDRIVRKRNGIPERLDSSYHDRIEEDVYGEGNINLLSTDLAEHMIIRDEYKTFMDKYVEEQEQQLLAVYLDPLRQSLEEERQRVTTLEQDNNQLREKITTLEKCFQNHAHEYTRGDPSQRYQTTGPLEHDSKKEKRCVQQ